MAQRASDTAFEVEAAEKGVRDATNQDTIARQAADGTLVGRLSSPLARKRSRRSGRRAKPPEPLGNAPPEDVVVE